MGLFDYLKCEYPLPGNAPANAADLDFQTKDLEDGLDQYQITADGRLVGPGPYADFAQSFTGTINFYWSNVVASGPGTYTANGEDAHRLEYEAVFIKGRVEQIIEIRNEKEPAASARNRRSVAEVLSGSDLAVRQARYAESLIGRELVVWWGGEPAKPYTATVRVENSRKLVVENANGKFEILDRSDRDRIFFDSLDAGQKCQDDRKADWDRRRTEYEAEIAEKVAPI